MNKEIVRQSNFEVLRIISIAMIIAFHYVFKGEFDFSSGGDILNKIIFDVVYYFGE